MGRTTLKQPNGKYAIFSSIIDGFVMGNMTREKMVDALVEEERGRIERQVKFVCDQLDAGIGSPYSDWTWDTALAEHIKRGHGELEYDPCS